MAWAILPVGAQEQHGRHLPPATDTLVAVSLAGAVAARLGGGALPAIAYGTSIEHIDFPGTLSLRWETLAAIVVDVVEGCWRHAVDPVFVLSGHGGNFILNPALRQLNADRRPEHQAVLIPEAVVFPALGEAELHAGRWETSLMLHLHPELVQMEEAVDEVPEGRHRGDLTNRPMQDFTASGVWGRPTEATAEEGRAQFESMVERVSAYVEGWLR